MLAIPSARARSRGTIILLAVVALVFATGMLAAAPDDASRGEETNPVTRSMLRRIPGAEVVWLSDGYGSMGNPELQHFRGIRTDTGEVVTDLDRHGSVAFSEDGSTLAVVDFPVYEAPSHGVTIDIYDAKTGVRKTRLPYAREIERSGWDANDNLYFSIVASLSPDGSRLYLLFEEKLSNRRAFTVSLEALDTVTGKTLRTQRLGVERCTTWPEMRHAPDGASLTVDSRWWPPRASGLEHRVWTFDARTLELIADVTPIEPTAGRCQGYEWTSAGGGTHYCWGPLSSGGSGIRATNAIDGALVGEVALDDTDYEVGVFLQSRDLRYLYSIDPLEGAAVTRIDLVSMTVDATVTLPPDPVSPEGAGNIVDRAWDRLTGWFGGAAAEAKGPYLPATAFFSPNGQYLYFTGADRVDPFEDANGFTRDLRMDGIWVLDTEAMAIVRHILPVREFFGSVRPSRDGTLIYAVDRLTDRLVVIDVETGSIARELDALTSTSYRMEWLPGTTPPGYRNISE